MSFLSLLSSHDLNVDSGGVMRIPPLRRDCLEYREMGLCPVDGATANCAHRDSVASCGVLLETAALCCVAQVPGHIRVRGIDVMNKKNRSVLVVSLLPLVLLGGVFTVAQANEGNTPATKQTLWSDPATWPDHKVPVAGDKVTIERGKDVVLDVSPPGLH